VALRDALPAGANRFSGNGLNPLLPPIDRERKVTEFEIDARMLLATWLTAH
jgi:hypothetical protein